MTDPETLKKIVAGMKVPDPQLDRVKPKSRDTYHSRANDVELELGGRFAKVTPTYVAGSEPTVQYPKLPEGSPFAGDPVADEPLIDGTGESNRLGYRIDGDQEPIAEPKVVRRRRRI